MRNTTIHFIFLIISSLSVFSSCAKQADYDISSEMPTDAVRTWIGPAFWANPLQDWQLKDGRIECIASGGHRNIYLLTHKIGSQGGDFSMSIRAENLNLTSDSLNKGWIGFDIGIKGEFDDYRDNAIRGRGFPVGITTDGQLFIGKINPKQKPFTDFALNEITIEIIATQQDDGDYIISMEVQNAESSQKIQRKEIVSTWIEGGISVICHNGPLKEFPDQIESEEYPVWGTASNTQRKGNTRYGFSEWKISGDKITNQKDHAFGPILFTMYTLGSGVLKLTAQMPPIGSKDGQTVALQTFSDDQWETIKHETINKLSRTATFRIEDWDTSTDEPYRLVYQLYSKGNELKDYYFEGIIRKEPTDKNELVVAGFTGNNDLGFPNTDIFESVKYHDPDLLFFSGDQIYEGVGGYGVQRTPLEKASVDYLRKWYLFGWAYGDLMRNRPTIAIPDDHDVYHGNIWGAGGITTPEGLNGAEAQDEGGYKMPAEWVNMVQRTQTAHLPDAFDPTPVKQGIGVYYSDLKYGGISFAILEDRKFKSAPKVLLPEAKINNGFVQNQEFDAIGKSDIEGAVLLGNRQLNFLEQWSSDWSQNTWMKVVLSQTIFANVATLPYKDSRSDVIVPKLRILEESEYPPDDVVIADFDSNGWPQTGRNKALIAIRKSFAIHYAGDQHLGSIIQYGVDHWHDAGYAFCVPSISNVWPRRWYPTEGGKNRKKDAPTYTGDFSDGFGNLMSVYAVSNPVFTGKKPAKLYDRATGYGIVRFNKNTRDITVECWPRQANPATDAQYPGWPVTINQEDNFLSNSPFFLPELHIKGFDNPVVQVIDESNHEIVFTLRIKGKDYQPKVLKKGLYTVKIGELGTDLEKTIKHLTATVKKVDAILVEF